MSLQFTLQHHSPSCRSALLQKMQQADSTNQDSLSQMAVTISRPYQQPLCRWASLYLTTKAAMVSDLAILPQRLLRAERSALYPQPDHNCLTTSYP